METIFRKLNETLYTIEQEFVRCFVIVGTERALLIDTGVEPFDIFPMLSEITKLPIMLCLSHSDCDHTANVEKFERVYIHQDEVPLLHRKEENRPELVPIQDGYQFDLGNRRIEVVALPGHTPGSIGFLDRQNKMFFSGDTVSYGPVYLFEGHRDINAYRQSLLKLKKMASADEFDQIYPCHNSCPVDNGTIDELLKFVDGILNGSIEGKPEYLPYQVKVPPKRYEYLKCSILYL